MRICVLFLILFILPQWAFATPNRVAALGGSIAMLPDDDTNIDLFPQHINRWNLVMLSGIDSGTPNYAIVIGEPGDKWGLYGGQGQVDDFFNLYRSIDANSAIRISMQLSRHDHEVSNNNNEDAPGNSSQTEENKYNNIDLQARYGINVGEQEMAAFFRFAYGPGTVGNLAFENLIGDYSSNSTTGTTKSSSSGDAKQTVFQIGVNLRRQIGFKLLNKVFAAATLTRTSGESNFSTDTTIIRDEDESSISASGALMLFTEKRIAENSRLIYGVGASGSVTSSEGKDKINDTSFDSKSLLIVSPQIRLGLETDIKFGKLRFGLQRDLNFLFYRDRDSKIQSGTNSDSNGEKRFDFLQNGSYTFTSGIGFEYKKLAIDLTLNNQIWTSGPQMLFDTGNGGIGVSADVIYTY